MDDDDDSEDGDDDDIDWHDGDDDEGVVKWSIVIKAEKKKI